MKKITIFIATLRTGGAERVVSLLSRELVEKGYEVEILLLFPDAPFYQVDPRIKITHVENENQKLNIVQKLLRMRHVFTMESEVVLSFLAPYNILALIANMINKTPIIVADRNDPRYIPRQIPLRYLRNFLYRFADAVVVQTSYNKAYFSKTVQKKSTIIFNPVDLGEMRGAALRTPKEKHIVSVGRLMPQKNQKMLLRAFAQVHERHPEYSLTIYGDGPEKEALTALIKELDLEGAVHLPGSVKNVYECIASAELFVMTSDYEGMPNALVEAMCLGLPCISTAVSGTSDLIEEGVSGEVVPCSNQEKLTYAMLELLEDDERRGCYAKNAVKIADKLQLSQITQKWLDVCQQVVK